MSYPTTESPSTADFWSDLIHVSGIRYNDRYDGNQFITQSEPEFAAAKDLRSSDDDRKRTVVSFIELEKNSDWYFGLYKITTQHAENKVNERAGAGDSFWITLVGFILDSSIGYEDISFAIAGSAESANAVDQRHFGMTIISQLVIAHMCWNELTPA